MQQDANNPIRFDFFLIKGGKWEETGFISTLKYKLKPQTLIQLYVISLPMGALSFINYEKLYSLFWCCMLFNPCMHPPTSPYTHLTNIIIQIKLIRDSAANYPHDHKLGCKAECEQPDVSSAGKY